jgi:hypothetical protein
MKIREANLVIACGLLLAFAAIGCNESTKNKPLSQEASNAATAPAPSAEPSPVAQPESTAPAATAASGAPAPAGAGTAPSAPAGAITGKILETMDSGGYTYMKLSSGGGEVWAAVNAAKVTKGQTVTVVNAMAMDGFESKTLHRKFDRILFGSLATPGTPGGAPPIDAAAAQGQMPPGHPDASDPKFREMMASQHAAAGQGPADVGSVKVPKAEGGKTVAEIYAERKALADKEVIVRGKVVKFLPEIMGRSWLHIRDGSGTAEAKDNDLTVTTDETVAIGDVVIVKGTVKIDQDFGAGYAYPVLIENAKLSK